jgi:23S rRNA (adenine2503-C2)-methyltransferase
MENIYELTLEDWKQWMRDHEQPAYRATQLYEWLWKRDAKEISGMQNLPLPLREMLEREFRMPQIKVVERQESADGSVKYALRLEDGQQVESVLIPSRERSTVCISSQAGCPLGCRFCATAHLGFKRHLTAYEMYAQVALARSESMQLYGHALSNIVWMGMGEPLLNFDAVKAAVGRVTAADGMAMSPSRITVSTSGICPGIRRMAKEMPAVNLAVSLHSADDLQRRELMPIGKKYPLTDLSDALSAYHESTGNRITIEYMLMDKVNDTMRHAELLLKFCRRFPVKVNIIEYNPHPYAPYRPSAAGREAAFVRMLEDKNLIVNIRRSKGRDIAAACGQLVNLRRPQ